MLADKSKRASIDGLNQLFQITKNPNSRTGIDVKVESIDDIGDPIMESRNLSGLINDIISKDIHKIHGLSFKSLVKNFTELYTNQKEINWKDYNMSHINISETTTKDDRYYEDYFKKKN